jgi:hypothetical protein
MKKALIPAFLLLLGSAVLGATVLREPLARAATPIASVFVTNDVSSPVPVHELNRDGDGNIKVHEQGTAKVAVSNPVMTVPLPPVTGGGSSIGLCGGGICDRSFSSPQTATALSIHLDPGAGAIVFKHEGSVVATFAGPWFGGNSSIVLALARPIAFDYVTCIVDPSASLKACTASWVGAES